MCHACVDELYVACGNKKSSTEEIFCGTFKGNSIAMINNFSIIYVPIQDFSTKFRHKPDTISLIFLKKGIANRCFLKRF